MLACIQSLINIALAEEGYLEKATNSQLDDKTANAGSNNYTKYARDLDAIDGFFNGNKNGFAWCAVFALWCFVQAYGVANTRKMLGIPVNSSAAGVLYLKRYVEAIGGFKKNNPQAGDLIFFVNSAGSYQHTGLVYDVDSSYVYTIEGNTSGASGVVANGGGVCKKKYSLSYSRIIGYGRADWSVVDSITKEGTYSANRYLTLEEMQVNARYICQELRKDGWSLQAICGMLGNFQTESTINPGIWQSLVSGNTSGGVGLCQWTPATTYLDWCSANGIAWADMDSALARIKYEMENGLQYYPTDEYPLTFAEFKVSKKDPAYLAMTFLNNYERPADRNQPSRGDQAAYWYDFLSDYFTGSEGSEGGSEGSETTRPQWKPETDENGNKRKRRKMAVWLLSVAAKRK